MPIVYYGLTYLEMKQGTDSLCRKGEKQQCFPKGSTSHLFVPFHLIHLKQSEVPLTL